MPFLSPNQQCQSTEGSSKLEWLLKRIFALSPQSPGQRAFMSFCLAYRFVVLLWAFVLSPALNNIFNTYMARCSLFVLKVPLNTNQPIDQPCVHDVSRCDKSGQRFKYTYYNKTHGEIWQSVEQLDKVVSRQYRICPRRLRCSRVDEPLHWMAPWKNRISFLQFYETGKIDDRIYRVVWFFHPRSLCTTHLMLFSERPPIYASCITISGGRTEQHVVIGLESWLQSIRICRHLFSILTE